MLRISFWADNEKLNDSKRIKIFFIYISLTPNPGESNGWRAPFFKLKPPLTISSFKSKLPSKSRYFVFSKDRAVFNAADIYKEEKIKSNQTYGYATAAKVAVVILALSTIGNNI